MFLLCGRERTNYTDIMRIAEFVGERSGWDFSKVRDEREPVPWNYEEVVRRYQRPEDRVLDIGTGGGEHFLEFATSFGRGIGIDFDPGMIRVARQNADEKTASHVSFETMDARHLRFPDASFDVVSNRHAPTA